MSIKITSRDVCNFWEFMTSHYNTTIINKQNADWKKLFNNVQHFSVNTLKSFGGEIQLVGILLEKMGVQTCKDFLENYATTLGDRIYVPFEIGDNSKISFESQIATCIHEHQHVVQYKKEPIAFLLRYLDRAQRAVFEADAYTCNLEFNHFVLSKNVTSNDCESYANSLKHYACTQDDIDVATKMLKTNLITINAGGIGTAAGKIGIRWLKTNL